MQRAARQVQPSLSAFRSVSKLPRGIAAVFPAAFAPSAPPSISASQAASRTHRVLAAAGGVDTAPRSDMSAASEAAPTGARALEMELQHACAAVRLASALCQARLTLHNPLTTHIDGCIAYTRSERGPHQPLLLLHYLGLAQSGQRLRLHALMKSTEERR